MVEGPARTARSSLRPGWLMANIATITRAQLRRLVPVPTLIAFATVRPSTGKVSTAPTITRRVRSAISERRSSACAASSSAGLLPTVGEAEGVAVGFLPGGVDDDRAVDHVQPAGESERSRPCRVEADRGAGVRGEGGVHTELGQHDAGGAVAASCRSKTGSRRGR